MAGGYWNKILRVDLSSESLKMETLQDVVAKEFIGGSALGTKILYDEVKPGTKGLAPDNKIIFALGPYQGTGVPGSGKWTVVSKSPQTGTFAVSTAGASWGQQLKKAGFDVLIIEGKSKRPVTLVINNDKITIESADDLWGKDAVETVDLIKSKQKNKNMGVLTIGPAGEKLISIACLVADKHSFAGRCGFGAVMGSKNLKAIAVHGSKEINVSNKELLNSLKKESRIKLSSLAKDFWTKYGTTGFVEGCEEIGDLPMKNWGGDTWPEGAKNLGGQEYKKILNAKPWPCVSCPVGCHRHISISSPTGYPDTQLEGAGPEYESLGLLGGSCLVDDLVAVAIANDLCNRLGIDCISAGAFVAFLMDCYDRGIITKSDLNGIEAKWGDGQVLIELIKQIGSKEGIGAIFTNGIREAAANIGKGADELTAEVKNLDLPAHDPRTYFSLAINYATSTRGACHLRGYPQFGESGSDPLVGHHCIPKRFSMEGQALLTVRYQDWSTIQDSLVDCLFMYHVGMGADEHIKMLNAITGWNMTDSEVFAVGERAWNIQRLINIGDGLTRADDRLPKKMYIPAKTGFREGKVPYNFEKYLDEYYHIRGWNSSGVPTQSKLKDLNIV